MQVLSDCACCCVLLQFEVLLRAHKTGVLRWQCSRWWSYRRCRHHRNLLVSHYTLLYDYTWWSAPGSIMKHPHLACNSCHPMALNASMTALLTAVLEHTATVYNYIQLCLLALLNSPAPAHKCCCQANIQELFTSLTLIKCAVSR